MLKKELEELKALDYDISLAGFDDAFLASLEPPKFNMRSGSGALAEKFLIPPFSILDTRQGYWQERKSEWKELGLDSGKGREEGLLGNGGLDQLAKNSGNKSLTGTSIFDPVLCELMYTWFCMPKGKILDPFAGGSVRGIVAEYLGYDYTGVDLSRKQIEANYENAKDLRWNKQKLTSAFTQSIVAGDSIPAMAKKISSVANMDWVAALRNARTMNTGAEAAGRLDAYNRAEKMGIDLKQEWVATLDGRTRDSHRDMDGETIKIGETFSNGLKFPGDPSGRPGEVYNCRCRTVAVVNGIDPMAFDKTDTLRRKLGNEDITYEEWKKGHQNKSLARGANKRNSIHSPIERRSDKGKPAAIVHMGSPLNNRQKKLLEQLTGAGSQITVKKSDVKMSDLAALTAETGVEFGLFTRKGERLIIRGDEMSVPVSISKAREMAAQ